MAKPKKQNTPPLVVTDVITVKNSTFGALSTTKPSHLMGISLTTGIITDDVCVR